MIELLVAGGAVAGGAVLGAWWSALEGRCQRTPWDDLREGRESEHMGEWDGALRSYSRAAKAKRRGQRPIAIQALFAMGRVYFKRGEPRRAIHCFSRLHGRRVSADLQAQALMSKARCFERLQLPEQARTSYRELCTRFPKSALAASAQREFHRLGPSDKRTFKERTSSVSSSAPLLLSR